MSKIRLLVLNFCYVLNAYLEEKVDRIIYLDLNE